MNAHSREAACIHVRAAAEEEEGLKLERASRGGRKTHTHTHAYTCTHVCAYLYCMYAYISVFTQCAFTRKHRREANDRMSTDNPPSSLYSLFIVAARQSHA